MIAFEANGGGLDGDGARAEGFRVKAVALQFAGDGGEDDHLLRQEIDQHGHEQALALHALDLALAEDFFEEDTLVGDVLIDDPQAFVVDGEDERVAQLAEGLEGGERIETGGGSWSSSTGVCESHSWAAWGMVEAMTSRPQRKKAAWR